MIRDRWVEISPLEFFWLLYKRLYLQDQDDVQAEVHSSPLIAMGLSEEEAHCAVRFSLGLENTKEEIDRTLSILGEIITEQKAMVRFVSCR